MKYYNKIVNECINYAQQKELKILIKKNKIIFSEIKGFLNNQKIFDFLEDTFYFVLKDKNNKTNIEKYLLINNETEVSVEVYFKN